MLLPSTRRGWVARRALPLLAAVCLSAALAGPALAHDATAPVLQTRVDPAYPEAALNAGIEGAVELELFIDTRGAVEHVHVISSPGYGLDAAATVAAKQFVFKPATSDGVPVPSKVLYEQRFAINRTVRGELTAEPDIARA